MKKPAPSANAGDSPAPATVLPPGNGHLSGNRDFVTKRNRRRPGRRRAVRDGGKARPRPDSGCCGCATIILLSNFTMCFYLALEIGAGIIPVLHGASTRGLSTIEQEGSLVDMTSRTTLWALSAGALALVLAGCGGGGSSSSMMTAPSSGGAPPPAMEMPDPHACDTGTPQECVTAREMELAAVEANPDATVAELDAAQMALDDANDMLTAHNTAAMENMTVSGVIDTAMMAVADIDDESTLAAVEAGRMAIDAAQESLDAQENLTDDQRTALQGRIDALEMAFGSNEMAVRVASATAAALTKEMAIGVEAAQTTDDSLGGEAASTNHTLAIVRDDDGTTVTITVDGAAADDPKFEKAADLMSSSNPGQMLARTMAADADGNVVAEVAIVYTDIDAPTPTAFAMVTNQALNARDLDPTMDGPDADTTVDNDFTALNVVNDNVAQVMSGGFTAAGSGTLAYAFDDASTMEMDEAFETEGTYNGAPGTYRCNGTGTCSVTYDATGAITAIAGDWVFTPDAGAMSPVPDANYLHYGVWLQRTTAENGAVTYNEVETFAGSSVAESGSVSDVSGMATYSGGAAGVYVHKTFATDGTSEATSGHFSADASLTAYFSGGATPAEKADTLTGTIDNFMLSGGEANSWSVALQSDGDDGTDGIQPDTDGTMTGTARGNVMSEAGSFTATYHGSVAETPGGSGMYPQPSAVTGEFNSVFSNGSVAGAFGANKDD